MNLIKAILEGEVKEESLAGVLPDLVSAALSQPEPESHTGQLSRELTVRSERLGTFVHQFVVLDESSGNFAHIGFA